MTSNSPNTGFSEHSIILIPIGFVQFFLLNMIGVEYAVIVYILYPDMTRLFFYVFIEKTRFVRLQVIRLY